MPASPASPDTAGRSRSPVNPEARRARPIYRVFVSSTWLDLQPERRALMDALNRMEEMRFVGMEFFGNRPDDTHDASIDQVDLCEVFVGIIGHRYGSGITEAEYRRARERGLPCFVYFKREETLRPELTDGDAALAAKLAAFKADLLRGHTVKEVAGPEELAANATADLHNWVAARWISLERQAPAASRAPVAAPDADRTNVLRLLERVEQDWIKGVLEASLHHRAWLELGLDWRDDAVEHPWDRIVVAPDRPIKTLSSEDSITGVFDAAQHTLLVLGEPGAGKTTTVLELTRDLVARARESAHEPVPVVLALSTWRGAHRDFSEWIVAELGLRYQVPKRLAKAWLDEARLVLVLDGLDEVPQDRRAACVEAINAFEQAHHPPGLAVTCRVVEYDALAVKLRLRAAICLQPLSPGQIERYFAAAGAGLEPLRRALRDDAGLRELAKSPLMLSVMTMAWRDAPAAALSEAGPGSSEDRRRQLFDAYVAAAMKRRGKATGGYSAEQTVQWLTWLACRMREHGHTVFAVEQLQPGWLDGMWRQFGYFMTTRLLGAFGLALPFIVWAPGVGLKGMVAGIAGALGAFFGAIDFGFAQHGWGGRRRAWFRFWALLLGSAIFFAGWQAANNRASNAVGISVIYLVMAGVAFCAPLDVRGLDIKPTGGMQWSWRLALARGLVVLMAVNGIVTGVVAWLAGTKLITAGWRPACTYLGGWPYLCGLAVAAGVAAFLWQRFQPPRTAMNRARAITLVLFGGQVGGALAHPSDWQAVSLGAELTAGVFLGVFSGFASTMIDPSRPRQAGAWFWLRAPVLACGVVGMVMMVPGLVWIYTIWDHAVRGELAKMTFFTVGCGGACGLVAFFRFGGFNGVQHFLLRRQLARSGKFPPEAETFFNHAAQLALMQKVGLGFRFVHALLLEHLAVTKGGAADRGAAEGGGGTPSAPEPARRGPFPIALRVGGLLALVFGVFVIACAVGTKYAARWLAVERWYWTDPAPFLGALTLTLWLLVPPACLGARWVWRQSWARLGGGGLVLALALAYLAVDDSEIRRPIPAEMTAPAFPGAEKSYAVLMRYGARHPAGRDFKLPRLYFSREPQFPVLWREFVTKNRVELERNWADLAPVRAWMEELSAFERIGDLSAESIGGEPIAWRVVRTYVGHAAAIATLQAIDGQGEAALATLWPLIDVGNKLERSARTSVHFGTARNFQWWGIRTIPVVLGIGAVPAATRAKFAAALDSGNGGSAGVRHLFAIKYAEVFASTSTFARASEFWTEGETGLFHSLNVAMGPFVFNRRAALNRYGELFADLEELAVKRDADKADKRVEAFLVAGSGHLIKNSGAEWLNWPIFSQSNLRRTGAMIKTYWELEDWRTTVRAELNKP